MLQSKRRVHEAARTYGFGGRLPGLNTGSFVLRTAEAGAEDVEAIIQDLAESFLKDKGYLLQRWSGKAVEA